MKKLIPPLVGLLSAVSVASGEILLNEVNLNPNGSDENYEFIELKSTTGGVEACTGLHLIIINNDERDGSGVFKNLGQIEEAWDLGEYSTGTNGLLLLGDGYAGSTKGGPWAGAIAPETAVADPKGLSAGNIGPNDGVSILLVRGFTGQQVDGEWPDVDVDNNGQFDWLQTPVPAGGLTAAPWTTIVDSIGTRDYNEVNDVRNRPPVDPYVPAAANLFRWTTRSGNQNTLDDRNPDTFARLRDSNTPNDAFQWYGAKFNDGAPSNSIVYRANRYFNFLGEVTPGRPNLQSALPPATFVINEVGLNPPGNTDYSDWFQYVEILNTNEGGRARSLAGYWLVLVDSEDDPTNNNGVGRILEQWDLSGFTTGSNGLLLLGDGFSTTNNPFQDFVDPETNLGDPSSRNGSATTQPASGWGRGDLKYSDGFTMFLIKDYKPNSVGTDDIDPGNTGDPSLASILLAGGATVVDQIGFTQQGKTGAGRTYAYTDLRAVMAPEMKQPENLSRKLGNLTTATTPAAGPAAASAWYGGVYGSDNQAMNVGFADSIPSEGVADRAATWFGGFRGAGTPGRPNLAGPLAPVTRDGTPSVRISEVMADPTNEAVSNRDLNREYIELVSTTQSMTHLDGLWVLIVDKTGNIADGFPLDGYMTGQKGIAIFGDNYDFDTPYQSQLGPIPVDTAIYDPDVALGGDDVPNDGFAVLLVRGIKGPVTRNAGGKAVGDIDPENDGTFLDPSEFTDELIDSVCCLPANPGPAYGWINSAPFLPHHVARVPFRYTANSATDWYYGQVDQTASTTPATEYTSNYGGPFKGAISPGRINHGAPTGSTAIGAVVLNEVHFNPAGRDDNYEFIELLDTAGTERSLNGYTLVVMDNTLPNTGEVLHAWSLDGFATGPNGLFVLGSGYPDRSPFKDVMSPQTRSGTPPGRPGLDTSFYDMVLGLKTSNDNLTLLLTRDFTRHVGYDFDAHVGADPTALEHQGDGLLESVITLGPVHDSVMLRDVTAANAWDGYPYVAGSSTFADLTTTFFGTTPTGFYTLKTVARFRGETTPNSPAAWYGGDLVGGTGGGDGADLTYDPGTAPGSNRPKPDGFVGAVTPGLPNLPRSAAPPDGDTDGDGLSDLLELALGSDPNDAKVAGPLPFASMVTVEGTTYPALTYQRLKGGSAGAGGVDYTSGSYDYTVESSTDLQTWAAAGVVPVSVTPNPDNVTETAVVRVPNPPANPPGRVFLRLKIGFR